MAEHNYEEKRNFVRMDIETRITYKVKGKDDITHNGTSYNISATGLSMMTETQLNEGDEIELVMNPSSDRLPPFVAEGIVLRVNKNERDSSKYDVSIKLTKTI